MMYLFSPCKFFSATSAKESPASPPVPQGWWGADGAVCVCPSLGAALLERWGQMYTRKCMRRTVTQPMQRGSSSTHICNTFWLHWKECERIPLTLFGPGFHSLSVKEVIRKWLHSVQKWYVEFWQGLQVILHLHNLSGRYKENLLCHTAYLQPWISLSSVALSCQL